MVFLLTPVTYGAVTRQNTVPSPATKGEGVTSLSWSHTVNAGSNLLLVVNASMDSSDSFPTSVTYNSVGMTNISNQNSSGSYGSTTAWYLVNPSTGANTVQVNFSPADSFAANSISFSGVNQATPIVSVTQGSTITDTVSVNITTVNGDYAYASLGINLDHALTVDAGTDEWQANNFGGASEATGAGASRAAVSSTTTIGWSWGSSNDTSYIGFAIQQTPIDAEQEGFRFRYDDGSETTAAWLAAQDTAVTRTLATNTRLRMLVNTSGDPASLQYQLEYKKSTDSDYKKVGTPSGSIAFGTAGGSIDGTSSLSVPYPANITAGDLLVLTVANKYPSNGPSTPSGWTAPANCQGSGGQGSSGADRGNVYSSVFVKEASVIQSGLQTVTITSGNSAVAAMLRYTKGEGKAWSYACTNGSDNTGNATSWSVTGAADPGIYTGDIVVVASAVNTDMYTFTSQSLSATGVTFGTHTERIDDASVSGDYSRLVVSDHTVSSGTSSAAPVFTMTSSGSATNRPAGASSILRIRQVDAPIVLSASSNVAASGENTTFQLTAPAGKATSDFVTGRMQDDENPADAVDITSNDYTELEWSLAATSTANNGEVYQFRVTAYGVALATYTVTPQWTIGSSVSSVSSGMFLTFD